MKVEDRCQLPFPKDKFNETQTTQNRDKTENREPLLEL